METLLLMVTLLNTVGTVTLALWVGCLFCFAALVAPLPFRMLSSRAEAGALNGAILHRVESVGLVLGGMALLAAAFAFGLAVQAGQAVALAGWRVAAIVIMLGCTLADMTAIRPRLEQIKQRIGRPLDDLPEDDPQRIEFNRLHRQSVQVFGAALLVGVAGIVLYGWR